MQVEEEPDPDWVAALAGVTLPRAQAVLTEAQGERALFRHLDRMHVEGGRSGYVEIDAPLELYALVRLLRPDHVVEVGVSSGVSSAYLLRAMERIGHGTLHSVDLPKTERPGRDASARRYPSWALPPGRSSGWAVPFPLRKRWDLRLGDKREVVPLLARELPAVGLFVYDVPHVEVQAGREFAELDRLLPKGAVAIADHGPGGGMCAPLRRWGSARGMRPVRRRGLGLYGFGCGRAPARPTRGSPRP
ncbi:MAG: class I SAM-dependent methyltransferase [Thermoplasmata archaeon]